MWGLGAKAFSGPLINFVDDLSHVLIAEIINVFSLWDILPDQTISVFVETPLPGMVWMSEEAQQADQKSLSALSQSTHAAISAVVPTSAISQLKTS